MHVLKIESLDTFCKSYSFNSLIKQPTCFKNPENSSCIDLILTNKPRSFQTKCIIETGLSDFHRMSIFVLTLLRMGLFGVAHGWWGTKKAPLLKICHTYPAIMSLGKVT